MATLEIAAGYQPFDKQQAFHKSPKRFKVIAAGNRGGKTLPAGAEFLKKIFLDHKAGKGKRAVRVGSIRVPRLSYWVVTPTHGLGEFPFREIVRFCPPQLFEKPPNATTRDIWLKGDIQIGFRSTERPELLVAESLNGLWMDEAPRCKAEAWRGALRARLADQEGWGIFTGSPLGGRSNWVYADLVSKVGIDPHVAAFSWTTADNPHVPRSEVEHAKATLPRAWYDRDWGASWDSFGGAIYEEFRDETHVTDEKRFRFEYGLGTRAWRDCFDRTIGIIDFGHTVAGCMLVIGELGDRNWVVLDEVYGPGIRPLSGSDRTWLGECQRVGREYGCEQFVGDPEDAGALFDLRNNGVSIQAAKKSIYTGIRRVASALHIDERTKKPGLRIFSRCVNTIREIRNYQWKPNREQTGFLEEPAPNQDDHAMDCLRYGAMELKLYDYVEQERDSSADSGSRQRGGRPIG